MRKTSKRAVALGAALTLALGGGVAYAYWSTSGSGTGSASTGTNVPVTVTQNTVVTGLYPGGPAVPVDFTVNNPASFAQSVNAVAVTVTGVAGCAATNFTVTPPTISNTVIAAGGSQLFAGSGLSVKLDETGVPQDGCKSVSVQLNYTVS